MQRRAHAVYCCWPAAGRELLLDGNVYGNKIRFDAKLGHEEGLFKERSPPLPPPPVDPTE
jgi:hypothetical protein